MDKRVNIFTKIVVMLLSLIIPVMIMFTITNITSVRVIQDEIEKLKASQFESLFLQLNDKIDQISINSIAMTNSPAIEEMEYQRFTDSVSDTHKIIRMINDDIRLRSGITGWQTEITVYSRLTNNVISTSPRIYEYNDEALLSSIIKGWQYEQRPNNDPHFVWYAVSPLMAYEKPEVARVVIKASFPVIYLQTMLDQYRSEGQGDPFLFHPQHGLISNRMMDKEHLDELTAFILSNSDTTPVINKTVDLSGIQYLTSYQKLNNMDWYLVDFVSMENIIAPITSSKRWFYITITVLLSLGIIASYVLYRNVQVPIRELVRHVQRIKRGDYETLISLNGGSEFSFLFQRFNEMSFQIRDLLETVYEERVRSREAVLKQLQSQINPHFLYNCLFFIKNMARMGDEETVVAMSLNLGEYFRYTTRLGVQNVSLQEEINVIINYLQIQNLRMKRIEYSIHIPDELLSLTIPLLLLQPVVENAIIHGLEPKEGMGEINIYGEVTESEYRIIVEDNGKGMTDDDLEQLQDMLKKKEEEIVGSFGLWNVNQRIKLNFGKQSGLQLEQKTRGGIKAIIAIQREMIKTDV